MLWIRACTALASGSEIGTSCRQQAPQPALQEITRPCASASETVRSTMFPARARASGIRESTGTKAVGASNSISIDPDEKRNATCADTVFGGSFIAGLSEVDVKGK